MRDGKISEALLAWYDTHARDLPWRVSPAMHATGQRPDPYRVWLSEIMLQQTTVAAVRAYFHRFTQLWPDVQALAAAPDGALRVHTVQGMQTITSSDISVRPASAAATLPRG